MPKSTTDEPSSVLPRRTTIMELIDAYHTLLIDAYGVLVTHTGVLDGAVELLARLKKTGKPYFILTNDASRTPETTASDYLASGVSVPAERIINSGSLIHDYFEAHGMEGSRCAAGRRGRPRR